MKGLKGLVLSVLVWPSFAQASASSWREECYEGIAYDLKTKERLYVERHRDRFRGDIPLEKQVRYVDPQGGTIVEKQVDYTPLGPRQPAYKLSDLRLGLREEVVVEGGGLKTFYKENASAAPLQGRLPLEKSTVIDAGFDFFVRENMARLLAGETLSYVFPLPSRADQVTLRLRLKENIVEDGRSVAVISNEVDSFFLRLFVPSIELRYDLKAGRLLAYRGLSNLSEPSGKKNFEVLIEFDPSQERACGTRPS